MTWFKVDDQFYLHPKVVGLDMAARGLWVSAGSYCAAHLTDGVLTGAQLKALGGTQRQAAALVAADLWTADDAPPATRRYEFKNWAEFQPMSGDVEARREEWRERKRNARREKGSEQGRSENVPAGLPQDVHPHVQQMSGTGTPQDVQRMSGSFPVPSRPVPTIKEEGGSSLTVSRGPDPTPSELADDRVEAASASPPADDWPTLDELATQRREQLAGATPDAWSTPDDPRCREHAGLPRDEVPPCGACGRVREWFTAQESATADARRTAIDACSWCDDRGMVDTHTTDGRPIAVKCDHNGPPAPPEATETAHKPLTDPDTRRALLDALKRPGGPF